MQAEEFEIYSNASAAKTLDVATELLRMRDAVGQLTKFKVRTALPVKVYVFNGERSFAPYRDAVMQRKSPGITGIFVGDDDGNVILIQADSQGGVDRIVYHELTHYFVKNTLRGLQLWFNEGLAEYYSTFGTSGTDVNLGRPVAEHVLWLREEPLIPLRELFATTEDSPTYNEGTRQGVFYAQSWALVHYLLRGSEERRAQLNTFLNLLNSGRPIDDAFSSAFAMTYEQLERELKTYVRKFAFPYTRFSLASLGERELAKPEPMSRDRVLAELGYLLAHSDPGNAEDAERFLEEAIAVNDELPMAHGELGRLYEVRRRPEEAERAYERAVQLGSSDARVYLLYGDAILDRLFRSGGYNAPKAQIQKARELLTKSTMLDPQSASAWSALGSTYVLEDGDPTAGIAALEKSLALAPGEDDAALHLVTLYARAGRRADAVRLIDTSIARKGDRELLAHAQRSLVFGDIRRIESLLRTEKYEEALTLTKTALPLAVDDSMKKYLVTIQQQIEQMVSGNAAIARLNEATARANERKYAEALAIIDETIPMITDPTMLAHAQELRTAIAAEAEKKKKTKK